MTPAMNDAQTLAAESLAPAGWSYDAGDGGAVWVGDHGDAWEIALDGSHHAATFDPTDAQADAAESDGLIAHPIRAELTTDATPGRGLMVIIDAHGVAHEYRPDGSRD
jgi:hypothetical protein